MSSPRRPDVRLDPRPARRHPDPRRPARRRGDAKVSTGCRPDAGVLSGRPRARRGSWRERVSGAGTPCRPRRVERARGRRRARGSAPRAGLMPECIPGSTTRGGALFGGDCIEMIPLPYPRIPTPLHQIALASMGMPFLDATELEELATTCRELGRYTFLLTVAPLRIVGGTGLGGQSDLLLLRGAVMRHAIVIPNLGLVEEVTLDRMDAGLWRSGGAGRRHRGDRDREGLVEIEAPAGGVLQIEIEPRPTDQGRRRARLHRGLKAELLADAHSGTTMRSGPPMPSSAIASPVRVQHPAAGTRRASSETLIPAPAHSVTGFRRRSADRLPGSQARGASSGLHER